MPEGRTKYLKIGDVIGTVKVADEQKGMLVELDVLYGGAINRASRNGPQFLKGADYAQKLQEFWDSDAGKDYVIYDTQRIIEDHQRAKAMYEAYFAKLRAEEAEKAAKLREEEAAKAAKLREEEAAKAAKLRAEETAKQEAIREEDKQRVIENMAQDRNSDAAKLLRLKKKAEEKRIAAEKAEQEASAPVKAPNAALEPEESEPNAQAEPDPAPAVSPAQTEPVAEDERTEAQEPDVPEESHSEPDESSADDAEAPAEPSAPPTVEAPEPQKNAPAQNERIHDTVDDCAEEDSAPYEEPGKAMTPNSNEKPVDPAEAHSDSHRAPMEQQAIQEQIHSENGPQIVKLVFPKWVKVVSIIALILLFLLVAVIVAKFVLLYLPTILNGKKLVSTGDVWNAITPSQLRAGPDL